MKGGGKGSDGPGREMLQERGEAEHDGHSTQTGADGGSGFNAG